jgi:phage shock protein A
MANDDSIPSTNLVLQALHGIRSDLKRVHVDLEQMHALQEATNERLERVENRVEHLEKRTTEGFLETNTKLAALTGKVSDLSDVVSDHGRRLDHTLTAGLGSEVRSQRVRVDRLESGRRVRTPAKPKKL